MTNKTAIDERHAAILTHMLGAGEHVRKSNHGYRNRFCADLGGDDYQILLEMAAIGLVTPGCVINDGRDQFFHATAAGCETIGLGKAATKRALCSP